MLLQPIFPSGRDLNEKLGALRLVASSYPRSGAVPRSIRIKSPHFSVSTELSCTEPTAPPSILDGVATYQHYPETAFSSLGSRHAESVRDLMRDLERVNRGARWWTNRERTVFSIRIETYV